MNLLIKKEGNSTNENLCIYIFCNMETLCAVCENNFCMHIFLDTVTRSGLCFLNFFGIKCFFKNVT